MHKPNRLWVPGRVMGVSPDTGGSLTLDNIVIYGEATVRVRGSAGADGVRQCFPGTTAPPMPGRLLHGPSPPLAAGRGDPLLAGVAPLRFPW